MMELFSCPYHTNSYCLLKTGTKPGPTKGTSFYICGHCPFSVHAKLSPVKCTVHKTHLIELQSFVNVKSAPEDLRQYFRCLGRNADESWCGYVTVPKKPTKVLTDKNLVRSDFKEKQKNLESTDEHAEVDSMEKPSKNSEKITKDSNNTDQRSMRMNEHVQSNDKEISSNEKTDETSVISFASLNKSKQHPESATSEMSANFADKSFKQYRESPRPPGKKSGQASAKSAIASNSEDSSDESDLDESRDARRGLEKLKISHKEELSELERYSVTNNSTRQDLCQVDDSAKKGKECSGQTLTSKMVTESLKKPVHSQKGDIKESLTTNIYNDEVANVTNLQENTATVVSKQSSANSLSIQPKVSYSVEYLKNLICQKEQLSKDLHKFQSSFRSLCLTSLPDNGQRILDKIKAMKNKIQDIDDEINKVRLHLGSQSHSMQSSINTNPSNGGISASDLHQNSSSSKHKIYPDSINQASIMLDTASCSNNNSNMLPAETIVQQQHYVQDFVHLPQHLQQLFAANPQAMTLYGGRMTARQLKEIGSITTDAIDKLHKQLESCPTEQTEFPDPHGLNVTLKPHQRHALAWLAWREKQVPPAGILADDMGLGKTLTTIAHVLRHKIAKAETNKDDWLNRDKQVQKLDKAVKKSGATLIVTPASVVHQWAKEIERRCHPGLLKFIIYHGPSREKNIQKIIDNDIVLTTYTIISKEVGSDKMESTDDPVRDREDAEETETKKNEKQDLPLLLKIGWERIVLDEAHNIKNHKSLTAQAVCRLRAVYRWALTGTPIQNDLLDMYSLLRFLRFTPFDEYKVWKKHIDSGKGDTKRLSTIVKALLLRRTKEQSNIDGKPMVTLPKKSTQTIKVDLSVDEKVVYDRLFKKTQSTVQEYVLRHAEKDSSVMGGVKQVVIKPSEDSKIQYHNGASSGGASQSGDVAVLMNSKRSTGSKILVSLLRLRQCCSHLSLMKSHLDATSIESDGIELTLEEQLKGMVLDEIDRDCNGSSSLKSSPLFDKSSLSTKLNCVMEKIASIRSVEGTAAKDKCVIVSQWTQMLEIVAHHLDKDGILYCIIQGDIPAKKRMDIVDNFNTNPKGAQILLLSLQAGGVGLNLIGGNHLFLLDIHWNPALEEQACDRIYRMGQQKNVFIYRFLCKDTIEEKIVALQETKRSLAKSVLSGERASHQKLTLTDLRSLFGV